MNKYKVYITTEKLNERITELMLIMLLVMVAFFCCYSDRLITVNFDDLGTWELVENNTFFKFVVNTIGNKFRPIANIFMYAFFIMCGSRPDVLGYLILLLHGIMTVFIYMLAKNYSENRIVAAGVSMLYLISRFAYYQATLYLGIMETCALFFSILLFSCTYCLLNKQCKNSKTLWTCAILFYVLASFSHERYMFLFPVIMYAAVFAKDVNRKKRVWYSILSILIFIIVIGVRNVYLGDGSWSGTGGTDILNTFSFTQALQFSFDQVLYLLGWNAGPGYLNGLPMENYGYGLMSNTILMNISLILLVVVSFYSVKEDKKQLIQHLKNSGLLMVFVGMCIACSSTTIRVEMRWLYTSYTAMILYIATLWLIIRKGNRKIKVIGIFAITLFIGSAFVHDFQLRRTWRNMYYQETKVAADSLYKETYEKYGDDLDDKRILLITQDKSIELPLTMQREISAYTSAINFSDNSIEIYDNPRDTAFNEIQPNAIYLIYEDNVFEDITDYFKTYVETMIDVHEGMDPDGWIYQKAHFTLYTEENGKVTLQFYTNTEQNLQDWNTHTGRIYIDGKKEVDFVMDSQLKVIDLILPSNKDVDIIIENDFVDPIAERNGIPMCYTVSILQNN